MKKIKLSEFNKIARYGDILLVQSTKPLGVVIKWFQELEGDEAIYTHAAIVAGHPPRIYEADKTIRLSSSNDYVDCRVCLIRHNLMTLARCHKAYMGVIRPHLGDIYPYHRLLLHGIDNSLNWVFRKVGLSFRAKFSKLISYDNAVCSELAYKYYWYVGLVDEWEGVNPDKIHDNAIEQPENWDIIYEGKLVL